MNMKTRHVLQIAIGLVSLALLALLLPVLAMVLLGLVTLILPMLLVVVPLLVPLSVAFLVHRLRGDGDPSGHAGTDAVTIGSPALHASAP